MTNDAELKRRQDWREQRTLWLNEWRMDVERELNTAWEAQKVGAEYAQIALRGCFFCNGGTLIALPPLMVWLKVEPSIEFRFAAIIFVVGLILAAISAIVTYLNFAGLAEVAYARSTIRAIEINKQYAPPNPAETNYIEIANSLLKAQQIEKRAARGMNWTYGIAMGSGVLSYAAFLGGVLWFNALVA